MILAADGPLAPYVVPAIAVVLVALLGWFERVSAQRRNAGLEDLKSALGARGELVGAMRERVEWLTARELECREENSEFRKQLGFPDRGPIAPPPPLPDYPHAKEPK